MSEQMNETQYKTLMDKLDVLERHSVTKADLWQAVITVQGFTFAVIVGITVILNALGAF